LHELFLSKTNSILTRNDVLDAEAFNVDGFLSKHTSVSSIQLIDLFGTNRAILHLEKPHL
jgi:hypothetical protein